MYAYEHTGGLLPRPDGGFVTDADRDEWRETVARHTRAHGGNAPDHRAEAAKLGAVVALFTIHIAAADPEYAAVLVDRLQAPDSADDSETALLADHLRHTADGLTDRIRDDAAARARAVELARAWGGRALADRVRDLTEQPTAGPATADVAVLLVASAAALASPDQ